MKKVEEKKREKEVRGRFCEGKILLLHSSVLALSSPARDAVD